MLHGGDEIDQKSHITQAVKGHDKGAELHQADSDTTTHRRPKSRHEETAEHSEHELEAAAEMKCPTRRTAAELHDFHADEDQQSEHRQRGQDEWHLLHIMGVPTQTTT